MYKFVAYGVRQDDERIDYHEIEKLAKEHKPKMIVAGASAYSRIIDFERIGKVAKAVEALFFVDMAHIAGLVAAGVHPSPIPHADLVPGDPGWSAGAHHRGQGGVSERSDGTGVPRIPATSGGQCQGDGRIGGQARLPDRDRGN